MKLIITLLPPAILGVASAPFVFAAADEAAVDVDVSPSPRDIDVEADPSQDIEIEAAGEVIANADDNEVADISSDVGEAPDEPDDRSPSEHHVPLPSSLRKAARVGANLREARGSQIDAEENPGGAAQESELDSPNTNAVDTEDTSSSPKPPLTGCHWGAMGCKKGKMGAGAGSVDMNASSVDGDGYSEDKSLHSSSFAGSATKRIEAHVLKGRGASLGKRRKPSTPDDGRPISPNASTFSSGHRPPQGFKLAGRIVTSPSDGLSYFLDSPQIDPEDDEGDWMMTIPYAYLECGPTIESTTEPFSLSDMVLRHFPVSASVGHWTNLGGGVTIVNGDEALGEDSGTKYIEGNREGHPKLLVALSPIEITVSGNDEESRIFSPGEVILMEDTLGKGHKMNAAHIHPEAHGQDLSVLMVSLPHTVHYPAYDGPEDSSYASESEDVDADEVTSDTLEGSPADSSLVSPPTSYGAEHALFGFGPKQLHQKPRSLRKQASLYAQMRKPCPLEYDSAYSSLFMPAHNPYYRTLRHNRRSPRWTVNDEQSSRESSFDEVYHPPPGFSTYEKHSMLFDFLPSLRRTMLFGLGLSMTSSFIYCVQLLYPPLLVLWGGATMVVGGALLSVLATRRGYRSWIANWEEEWRWKREVKRNRMHREEMLQQRAEDIIREEIQHNPENEMADAFLSEESTVTEEMMGTG